MSVKSRCILFCTILEIGCTFVTNSPSLTLAGYSSNIGRYIHEAKYKSSVRVRASLNLYSMFQGMEELLRQMWKRCNLLENEMFELRVPLHTSSSPPLATKHLYFFTKWLSVAIYKPLFLSLEIDTYSMSVFHLTILSSTKASCPCIPSQYLLELNKTPNVLILC
jgi:hypothetical protein